MGIAVDNMTKFELNLGLIVPAHQRYYWYIDINQKKEKIINDLDYDASVNSLSIISIDPNGASNNGTVINYPADWNAVTNGKIDDSLKLWAQLITYYASRSKKSTSMIVIFSHEPEGKDKKGYSDFIAAYNYFYIFMKPLVPSTVAFALDFISTSFGQPTFIQDWIPENRNNYDIIGGDGYAGGGDKINDIHYKWKNYEFSQIFADMVSVAQQLKVPCFAFEYGASFNPNDPSSNVNINQSIWLTNMWNYLTSNSNTNIVGASYWNQNVPSKNNYFTMSSSALSVF